MMTIERHYGAVYMSVKVPKRGRAFECGQERDDHFVCFGQNESPGCSGRQLTSKEGPLKDVKQILT